MSGARTTSSCREWADGPERKKVLWVCRRCGHNICSSVLSVDVKGYKESRVFQKFSDYLISIRVFSTKLFFFWEEKISENFIFLLARILNSLIRLRQGEASSQNITTRTFSVLLKFRILIMIFNHSAGFRTSTKRIAGLNLLIKTRVSSVG